MSSTTDSAPQGKAVETPAAPPRRHRPSFELAFVRTLFVKYGMVLVLILLALVANGLYSGFLTSANLNNVVGQVAPTAIVAVGMTYVIISGGFDLSVGAVFAGGAVLYADLSNKMPLTAAFALTVVIGILAGIFNGAVITGLNVNPFIATLASASLFSGAVYLYANSAPIQSTVAVFTDMGSGKWGGVWIATYILIGLLIVGGLVLARTPYGRSIYAVGGNLEAARLAGMRVKLVKISAFAIASSCAAIGGMIVASQTGVGQANIGPTVTLDAIAIVIIGGTSLMGGEGAMWRTVIGLLMWGTISNVFNSLALDTSSQLLMQGAILLVAVSLDAIARRSRK
ncbi:ribose ABC transporter permease [Rhodococcus sp. 14-2496-1d]|uniref:ABC transporter permease n=1 Tax=Rhodococcus sp. 14-2496-1d TaxID=2023146 RepID=UPI000B9C4A2D|nr:ABC transporter permease [Rhodococcus sp. 14-2496-1d]OZF25705.1 ribose ABC transporter permease [Rhodococcus sp. 14-2496-1d]